MKKYILLIFIPIIYLSSVKGYAADNPLPVYLEGTVIVYTCGVEESEENKYVRLGTYATKDLKGVGTKSQSVLIPFHLMNCGPNIPVKITFSGNRDLTNNKFLGLTPNKSVAKNIAIEMLDAQRKSLPVGQKSSYIPDVEGNVYTHFYAHYVATQESVTAGKANAKATFIIEYD